MKRRNFLVLAALALSCDGKGILPLEPEDNNTPQDRKDSVNLISGLDDPPQPIFTPIGNVLYRDAVFFKQIDTRGKPKGSLRVLGDNDPRTFSNPRLQRNMVTYQINNLDNTSEIWQINLFGGLSEKLTFELGPGNYEYSTLNPNEDLLLFTFNNKTYVAEYPSTKEFAFELPIVELIRDPKIINGNFTWVGMYHWAQNGVVFSAKGYDSEGRTNIYLLEGLTRKAFEEVKERKFDSLRVNQVTKDLSHDHNPFLYGDKVFYDSDKDSIKNEHDIFSVNINGTNPKRMTGLEASYKPSMITDIAGYTHPSVYGGDLIYAFCMLKNWNGILLIPDAA